MIKLSKPYIPVEAIENLVQIIQSGNLVQGKMVQEFESLLQDYLDTKHAVVVSSGTAALHLALIALGIHDGDEVIVPAFTFPATANAVELTGATPVFVDVGLDDFCMDASRLEKAITPRTKAIIPVHEFGQAAPMNEILTISRNHNLVLIEDAACALGTEYNGKKAGTFGLIGCFSFHPRKAITTGEGGVVVTNDDELAAKIRSLRNHGIQYHEGKMDFMAAGLNYRLTDFQAAMGIPQLREIKSIIDHRIALARKYDQLLADISWIKSPQRFQNRKMVYQTYHVLVNESVDRNTLMTSLKELGVETNYGAQALNCIAFYMNKYHLNDNSFPNATYAYRHGLALPMGIHVNQDDISQIGNILKHYTHAHP